ncbi:MAG: hypothetical protein ACTSRG_09945 [Candidatus Helarchaeota archaeon]
MGTTYKFECKDCGISVEVSGCLDYGKQIVTATILCEKCGQLSDVIISNNPEKTRIATWRLPKRINCPECNSNLTKLWEHPGPCPKCGKTMDRLDPVALWD